MKRLRIERRGWLQVVRALCLTALDTFAFSEPGATLKKHVLIVKLDAIGDFVLWLDACRALVARYRREGHKVYLLASDAWADWATEMRLADETWPLDTTRFESDLGYRRSWLRRVSAERFEQVIQPTHSRRFLLGDTLVRASRAPARIGFVGDSVNIHPWLKRISDRWYTRLVVAPPAAPMELMRHRWFLHDLGISDFRAAIPTIDRGDASVDAGIKAPYAVLFPGAGWEGRIWPSEKFCEIGRRLTALGLSIVVAGSEEDRLPAGVLMTCLGGLAIDLVGKTSLPELSETIRGASLVVSNESSAAHIGAALGTPTVCVLGGGHYGRFFPYEVERHDPVRPQPSCVTRQMPCFGCNWKCIHPRDAGEAVKCIRDIEVSEVWGEVERTLAARQPRAVGQVFRKGGTG